MGAEQSKIRDAGIVADRLEKQISDIDTKNFASKMCLEKANAMLDKAIRSINEAIMYEAIQTEWENKVEATN